MICSTDAKTIRAQQLFIAGQKEKIQDLRAAIEKAEG